MSNVTVVVTLRTGTKFLHSYNGHKPKFVRSLERYLRSHDDLPRKMYGGKL